MQRIRVLIVDDSSIIRRLLASILSRESDIEVVGSAADGQEAIAAVAQHAPDIVTLDVEMPVMDGLQTLAALRKDHPRLPVIMFSAVTTRAAAATLHALALGASDYVTKPERTTAEGAAAHVREQLVPRIRAIVGAVTPPVRAPEVGESGLRSSTHLRVSRAPSTAPIEVLAIGASTGGPQALATILAGLRKPFPIPIVVVQHMPPLFTRMLAERLAISTPWRVREAENGALLEPDSVLIAPGDQHMQVRRDGAAARVVLTRDPPENSCRPAVDVLFRSCADVFGARMLAVVLTGMGRDGANGCARVRAAGGQIVVQDQASSVVWGMPGAVARANLADAIVGIDALAHELSTRATRDRGSRDRVSISAPDDRARRGNGA